MSKTQWQKLPEPYDKDFRYFLVLVWRHLQLPDPTPVQLDIAEYMQNGSKRRIIEAFRGGKVVDGRSLHVMAFA